jgi:hypothetical protein
MTMRRLISYAIAAAVIWAAWHVGAAQWQQFEFQDDLKQIALFGAEQGEEPVRAAVMEAAAARRVPLSPERLQVQRLADHLHLTATYTTQIEVFPRYTYPWTFTVSAEGWFVPGGRAPIRR